MQQDAASKPRNPRRVSPANLSLQAVAAEWAATPPEVRSEWDSATAILHDGLQPSQLARVTGYSTYVKYNLVNHGVQNPLLVSPPDFGPVSPLPDISLTASFSPTTGLSLVLSTDTPVTGKLEIWGTRPLLPNRPVYDTTKFTRCGYLGSLNSEDDVASIYLSRYRVPAAGYKIALQLVGVNLHGQRTAPLLVVQIAAAPGVAVAQTEPDAHLEIG